jgi:hypothetical protein
MELFVDFLTNRSHETYNTRKGVRTQWWWEGVNLKMWSGQGR